MATTKAQDSKNITQKVVMPALIKEFGYNNVMAVPKIEKISINMGMGEATPNPKLIDGAVKELAAIAGQKPVITKAKKSIAAFKLREGMPIGVHGHSSRRPHVRISRPSDDSGAAARARFPRGVAEVI